LEGATLNRLRRAGVEDLDRENSCESQGRHEGGDFGTGHLAFCERANEAEVIKGAILVKGSMKGVADRSGRSRQKQKSEHQRQRPFDAAEGPGQSGFQLHDFASIKHIGWGVASSTSTICYFSCLGISTTLPSRISMLSSRFNAIEARELLLIPVARFCCRMRSRYF